MRIEIHIEGQWRHCAELADQSGNRELSARITYEVDYALEHLYARDHRALSTRIPIDLGPLEFSQWHAFLLDLLPQGAARRRLEGEAAGSLSEWDLLQRGAFNPVGNLRIVPTRKSPHARHRPFTLDELTASAASIPW
jgi:serine/threonine-protein kinase HipA